MIDIIVPIYNQLDKTKLFISSLKYQNESFRLILIDNASDNETKSYLSCLEAEVISNSENRGYVKAVNQGLRKSRAERILLANNDIVLPPQLLRSLKKHLEEFDIVAPLSNNISSDENLDNPLLITYTWTNPEDFCAFNRRLRRSSLNKVEIVDHVYGHCMMFRRQVFEDVGFLDERFGLGNYDDLDFCYRAKQKGKRIGLVKECMVYHFCHSTFRSLGIDIDKLLHENRVIFEEKWQTFL